MARTRTPTSIPKSVASLSKPQIYAEGPHDYDYLTALTKNDVILEYAKGTPLPATSIKPRIESIKRDIENTAIDFVIWIVDGGDDHIKAPTFIKFYKKWLSKKEGDWKKLHILINSPCLEYWFLLHRINPPIGAKKGVPICFENAKALLDSKEFKKYCQEGKGANLVKAIVSDTAGRNQAIRRAKGLSSQLNNLTDKNLLNVARAEMYQIFDLIKVEFPSYSY